MALKFNPETGYSDQASFPTVPASEAEARADLQEIPNQIRDYINKYLNYANDTGSANAYAVTLDPAPVSYTEPLMVFFKATNANTGASTLNVNGLGVKAIKKRGTTALAANDIKAGQVTGVIYDGTNFQLLAGTDAIDLSGYAALAGATMTGTLVCANNTAYTTKQARNIVLSTSDPSGGGNGDVWFKYTP